MSTRYYIDADRQIRRQGSGNRFVSGSQVLPSWLGFIRTGDPKPAQNIFVNVNAQVTSLTGAFKDLEDMVAAGTLSHNQFKRRIDW